MNEGHNTTGALIVASAEGNGPTEQSIIWKQEGLKDNTMETEPQLSSACTRCIARP